MIGLEIASLIKNGKTITLVPLSPKQVYDDQMKLKRKCEVGKSEDSREDNGERRPSDSAKLSPKQGLRDHVIMRFTSIMLLNFSV